MTSHESANRQFTNSPIHQLLRFLMWRVLATEAAVLAELEPLGRGLLVLRCAVVAALTFGARERNDVSHGCISRIW
jgi:hypothetical protein